MRRATLACALVLGCGLEASPAHAQDRGAEGPDPTGSLPVQVYARMPLLVKRLEGDASGEVAAELRSLCATHGAEATMNALRLGQRFGTASRVEDSLRGGMPTEASMVALFDAAWRPDPTGLAFVRVRIGTMNDEPWFGSGWLARQDEGTVDVLGDDLSMTRHWGRPEPLEFRAYCLARISEKPVDPSQEDAWFRFEEGEAFRDCVLAYWCFRRGDIGHAMRLWERARSVFAHPLFHRAEEGETFEQFIGESLATALEQQAVLAAGDGEGRGALRERWRAVVRVRAGRAAILRDPPTIPPLDLGAAMPFSRFGWHDAAEMVRLYDRLLAEDATWREPPAEDLAAGDAGTRARFWMHRLRESQAGRHHQGSHMSSEISWGPEHDPARRLLALGWSAVPVLIEHYDDPRPTRGHRSYYSRGTGETSCTPWRYADVSTELLGLITGEVFRNRAAAAEWWRTARRSDLPAGYLEQLRSADAEAREKAALWLLGLDGRAYADAVIARVLDGDPARRAMLAFLKGHVREREAAMLMPLLERGDHWTMLATAWALQETGHARDARLALLDRLANEPAEEEAKGGFFHLAAMQDDGLRASFARSLSKAKGRSRDLLLDSAHLFPCPEVLAALVALLGEDGRAVIAVRRMLIDEAPAGDEPEWREAEVREWLARNEPDWAALRRGVRARSHWYGAHTFYPAWFR